MFLASACSGPQRVDTDKSQTRLELAKALVQKGDWEGARREARSALRYDPGNVEAVNVIGMTHLYEGATTEYLIEVKDCLTGVDAEALREEGEEHLQKAEQFFARAVRRDRAYGEAWFNRGNVAMQRDEHGVAIGYFREALSHPTRLISIGLTRANLGWAYFHNKEYAKSARELRQSLQFSPNLCHASYRLGRVYFARQEWEKALESFGKVVSEPKCASHQEAHLYLMKTHVQLGHQVELAPLGRTCVRLAEKSCIAAQCRALVP